MFIVSLFVINLFALAQAVDPIPDPDTLLKEIQANQHKMDEIRENYTFQRIMTEEDLDDKGAVVKTTSSEREVFFVNGYQIARLVKKEGVELTGSEEKKERARVRKMVEMRVKSAPNTKLGRRGSAGLIGEILPMAEISNPRRVLLHDRTTLAFDFIGDPHAKGKDTEQNAMNE
jgi:hypothetical protein